MPKQLLLSLCTACTTLVDEDPLADENSISKALDILNDQIDAFKDDLQIEKIYDFFKVVNAVSVEVDKNLEELKVSISENNEFLLESLLSFLSTLIFSRQKELEIFDSKVIKDLVTLANFGQSANLEGISERAVYLLKLLIKVAGENIETLLPENSTLEAAVLKLIS